MNTLEFKKFVEDGHKFTQSIKSTLGRINKSLTEISEYLNNFKYGESNITMVSDTI